jgi:hypothetical protein
MYQTIIKGAKIEYGDEFYRKIYIYNQQSNETEAINDDGTYIISNDTLVGRINQDNTTFTETKKMRAEFEPDLVFMTRYFFLIISFLSMIFILVMILLISMYFCFHVIDDVKARRVLTYERARRNVAIMRMMNCVPYSNFMIGESKDCPICLQEFTQDC